VRLPARRSDDADVIRARLRALLAEGARPGWVPSDPVAEAGEEEEPEVADVDAPPPGRPDGLEASPGGGRHRAAAPVLRVDPGRPGARALWVAGAVVVVLLLFWTWLQRPAAEPVPVGS